jgi:DNA-binding winged helix-turn-helix (wHTH) protein
MATERNMGDRGTRMLEPGWGLPERRRSQRAGEARPIGFGEFLALPAARSLLFRGAMVELGSRAFDLLIVLLRSRGEIVSKEEIVRHVWPTTNVAESNLRFQMMTLRKALGRDRDRIKTVPGRGYLFIADDGQPAPTPFRETGEEPDVRGRPSKAAIVIIDENRENREALHRLLRTFDAHVESFVSVAAFLRSGVAASREPGPPA